MRDRGRLQKKSSVPADELWRYCRRAEERLIWQAYKRWPELFPYTDAEELTDGEIQWLHMQTEIDDGLQWCESCREFGKYRFCGSCGRRFIGRELSWRECPQCHTEVTSDYCVVCGEELMTPLERMLQGENAVEAWHSISQQSSALMKRFLAARPDVAAELGAPGNRQASVASAITETFSGR